VAIVALVVPEFFSQHFHDRLHLILLAIITIVAANGLSLFAIVPPLANHISAFFVPIYIGTNPELVSSLPRKTGALAIGLCLNSSQANDCHNTI